MRAQARCAPTTRASALTVRNEPTGDDAGAHAVNWNRIVSGHVVTRMDGQEMGAMAEAAKIAAAVLIAYAAIAAVTAIWVMYSEREYREGALGAVVDGLMWPLYVVEGAAIVIAAMSM